MVRRIAGCMPDGAGRPDVAGKLPVRLSSFVGREAELAELTDPALQPPGADLVMLDAPQPGDYVVRVNYFVAVSGSYQVTASRATVTREITTGHPDAYELTCEEPDGTVLERRD